MMQFPERHVLTASKPCAVKRLLDALTTGVLSDGGLAPETRRGLQEFSKQGYSRLILNLQVISAPFAGTPFMKLQACQLGGVLVVTGQVTRPRMLQVEEICHPNYFKHLVSGVEALVSRTVSGIESGVQRIARAARRAR
jgi:hypothetical protein